METAFIIILMIIIVFQFLVIAIREESHYRRLKSDITYVYYGNMYREILEVEQGFNYPSLKRDPYVKAMLDVNGSRIWTERLTPIAFSKRTIDESEYLNKQLEGDI